MYFVNREVLEDRLRYINKVLEYLKEQQNAPSSIQEILACERAIHMSIEAILDVGNQIIDGFIMRDPGSYEDIIHILQDEQVISSQEEEQLISYIKLRKALLSDYDKLQATTIWEVFQGSKEALHAFPMKVNSYLDESLGPVNAFIPDKKK